MMKYFLGSSPVLTEHEHLAVVMRPGVPLGTNTALSRAAFSSPRVAYARRACGKIPPFWSRKFDTSNVTKSVMRSLPHASPPAAASYDQVNSEGKALTS